MKNLLILAFTAFICFEAVGQFRTTTWDMTIKEVGASENIPLNRSTLYDFKNGNENLGLKGNSPFTSIDSRVTQNFLFVDDELKVGSYTFLKLDLEKVETLVSGLHAEIGDYKFAYGNAKLAKIFESPGDNGYFDYLYNGNSIQITWAEQGNSIIVLRIINTNSDLFGIWGWLSYYQKDYYKKHVEPQYNRNLRATANTQFSSVDRIEDN